MVNDQTMLGNLPSDKWRPIANLFGQPENWDAEYVGIGLVAIKDEGQMVFTACGVAGILKNKKGRRFTGRAPLPLELLGFHRGLCEDRRCPTKWGFTLASL